MRFWNHIGIVLAATAICVVGCAAPVAPNAVDRGTTDSPRASGPKRITTAMMGNPPSIPEKAIGGGSGGRIPGITGLEQLVGAGLTIKNDKGALLPHLAEAVPSIENGHWKVFADGRMETTWIVRPGVAWHDGTPFTTEDIVFSSRVETDPALPWERFPEYAIIDRVEAPDQRTLRVTWKRPYIDADLYMMTPPLPRHLLERHYGESKESFGALPYWNVEYVGNGPYRLKEWVRDSHAVLQANDQWVLGRPKIDEMEVRFLADENAFMAAIIANAIDVTLGKSISLEQTIQVRDSWKNGRVEIVPETAMKIWPQFINTNPAIVTDVRFRRAMFHAINRQEMVDTILGGLSTIAHTIILPNEPELAEVDSALVKYEFDARRATQMIEALGYMKGPDGMFRDAAGPPLAVQISATNEDQNTKPMFSVADYWQRLGVATEPIVIPIQRQRDREYRATFSAFTLQGGGSGVLAVKASHGSQARLPENNFTGSNYSRYMNPEFDGLIDKYLSTIPRQERIEALRAVVSHMTDQLSMMNLYYAMASTMLANRMQNAGRDPTWNVHQWDVKK